jgi:hypothetical protein
VSPAIPVTNASSVAMSRPAARFKDPVSRRTSLRRLPRARAG